ncbi:MAG: FAD-dependent oxidoreductase [Firmicutes bacterium]|nr:FAD-dependent oxidoreductase [Bacillota bacterium]
MIRLRQIKIAAIKNDMNELLEKVSKELRINKKNITSYKISKKSLDARNKPKLYFIYEIDVEVKNEDDILKKINNKDIFKSPKEEYEFIPSGNILLKQRPIIVGSGPAGLFCAYMLSKYGFKPIIIERGKKVGERVIDIETFWKNNKLNEESNVLFGEGGAGTFSDGKLNTMVKDKRFMQKKIFEIFIENGAKEEIMYDYKPHIGTDILRTVVKNMRNKIIDMGGEFRFETKLTNIKYENNKLKSIELNNEEILDTDILVLAIGHSARDTFKMLYENKLSMDSKPFAVGIRIQHKQKDINKAQLGTEDVKTIGAMNYKLTYKAKNERGVYTFCMCPGGYVVNSSSEKGYLCINGMSNYKRESDNANSAIIVTINKNDFGDNPLDGIKYQRELEKRAYDIGNGLIPTQKYIDYKNNVASLNLGNIKPIFKGNYTLTNINDIFPEHINESLKEAIDYFSNKIEGYNNDDVLISAVESRTSSPVKIIRDENLESNILGIYPCGEGAGYAGGITSAAMDGLRVFESIASKYKM